MKKYIEVKTKFTGFHRWKKAPKEVKFLRDYHRHEFNVILSFEVQDSDRELEFFMVKKVLDDYLKDKYEGKKFDLSCEMIAQNLVEQFNAFACRVQEDDQNAGVVINN